MTHMYIFSVTFNDLSTHSSRPQDESNTTHVVKNYSHSFLSIYFLGHMLGTPCILFLRLQQCENMSFMQTEREDSLTALLFLEPHTHLVVATHYAC